MSSIDISSLFGSVENSNSNTRGRKQTIQNADLMELSTSSPPSRFRNTDVSSPPSGRNQNNFDLELDEVENQQGRDESQLNINDVNRIVLSNASQSEKQQKLEWTLMCNRLNAKHNEEKIQLALNYVAPTSQYNMNRSRTPLLLPDDEEDLEPPTRRPRLMLEAPMAGVAATDNDKIFKIIGLVKQRFIELNETSLFQETSILQNERLVKILLELSVFTSLEDFNNHIQVHLETISTSSFVFCYCILFLKVNLLIKVSFSDETLSFKKDFNLPELVSKMTKLNLDLRCNNNQKKKKNEVEGDTVLEANPFGLFLDELESMTKGDVNNERMTRTIQLLNQCEDSALYKNWFKHKDNKEQRDRVTLLRQYEQNIFGLTEYPISEQLLTQDKQSILTLLFLFFHFPVQNLYSMLFGNQFSHGSFGYWKINSTSRHKQLKSMTRFKKLVGSFSKNTTSSSSSLGEQVTGSTEKKKRNNKMNCHFKPILGESVLELDAIESMFTDAKDERNYTMVRLDVFRELFATMLIVDCGKELFNNNRSCSEGTLALSIKDLSHHVKVNGSFFNISQGTGTKSSLETIVGNLLSLLPNPALSRYNLLHYLYNNWNSSGAPSELHQDNMSPLMTSQYEDYKKEYLLFMLGLSVF